MSIKWKIKIKKEYKGKDVGVIIYDKMRHKKIYTKINVIIKEVKPTAYVITIEKIMII